MPAAVPGMSLYPSDSQEGGRGLLTVRGLTPFIPLNHSPPHLCLVSDISPSQVRLGDSLCPSSSQGHPTWHKLCPLNPRWSYYQGRKEPSLTSKEVRGQIPVPRGPGLWGHLSDISPAHDVQGNGELPMQEGTESPGSAVASISEGLMVPWGPALP